MAITRTDRNQRFVNGVLQTEAVVILDVTAEAVTADINTKARQALTANATFLAVAAPTNAQTLAQVQRLTRECSALIRLLIGNDLLTENTDT